jgi:hypothetical protein
LNAQREVLTTSLESPGSITAAAVPIDPVTVATKPVKKARPPEREKQKPRGMAPDEHHHADRTATPPQLTGKFDFPATLGHRGQIPDPIALEEYLPTY